MRFLEFIHKVDEDVLLEAAKDRYMQMFQGLPIELMDKYLPNMTDEIPKRIKWAMKTFKKNNSVTWWLRYYRLYLLKASSSRQVEPEDQNTANAATDMFNKTVRQMGAKSGIGDDISGFADNILSPNEGDMFEHYMSLPVEGIQNYQFEWQSPYDVLNEFSRLEAAWQKELQGNVPIRNEHKSVVKFPDGSAWVDLGVAGCDEEGAAMGHCGNAPTQREGQTVLSYRTPAIDKNGNKVWKPRLTFILDTNTGMIGEMKGRNNNKPDKKYHEVIIELLKRPFIKGIVGGGYKPENNFRLSDLDSDKFDEMMDFNPALGNIYDQFLYEGSAVTPELETKLDSILSDDLGLSFYGYDYKNRRFILDDSIGNAAAVFDSAQHVSSELWIADDDMRKLMFFVFENNMEDGTLISLAKYYNEEYPDEEPIKDMTNHSDIYEALYEEGDIIIDEFTEVITSYLEDTTESDMEQQIFSTDDYNYEENRTGMFFDQGGVENTFRLVASPDGFLEFDLPKAKDYENGTLNSWMEIAPIDYFRDPNESWNEQLLGEYGDDSAKSDFSDQIIIEVSKKPGFKAAMERGESVNLKSEREAGQQRLFASKGKTK